MDYPIIEKTTLLFSRETCIDYDSGMEQLCAYSHNKLTIIDPLQGYLKSWSSGPGCFTLF